MLELEETNVEGGKGFSEMYLVNSPVATLTVSHCKCECVSGFDTQMINTKVGRIIAYLQQLDVIHWLIVTHKYTRAFVSYNITI